jgi:hypothetical protein
VSVLSRTVGERIERAACEYFGLTETDKEWFDAEFSDDFGGVFGSPIANSGDIVEVKGAVVRTSSGQRGRWLVKRRAHERLVEVSRDLDDDRDTWYVLVVYSPSPSTVDDPNDLEIERIGLARAEAVDGLLDAVEWVDTGRGQQEQKQLCWRHVFADLEHPGNEIAALGRSDA